GYLNDLIEVPVTALQAKILFSALESDTGVRFTPQAYHSVSSATKHLRGYRFSHHLQKLP
ncbi:MAG TPA: hypothetical protein VMV39_04100, partial [Terracidiphilus sp.]|nr:hypothetical protein [Terracidiphilus sp.]